MNAKTARGSPASGTLAAALASERVRRGPHRWAWRGAAPSPASRA
ncbi:MAG TPA: hypothetical protein P5165_11680 [Spirochaetia bacterium]|nr:hypothetical protein [Spirochaetales bacterium]HRY73874.1 hypothetical protein [Spirochaetia bacterium]